MQPIDLIQSIIELFIGHGPVSHSQKAGRLPQSIDCSWLNMCTHKPQTREINWTELWYTFFIVTSTDSDTKERKIKVKECSPILRVSTHSFTLYNYLENITNFWKILSNRKYVFQLSLKLLSEMFFSSINIEWYVQRNALGLHAKWSLNDPL
jgi:hypothetical protein